MNDLLGLTRIFFFFFLPLNNYKAILIVFLFFLEELSPFFGLKEMSVDHFEKEGRSLSIHSQGNAPSLHTSISTTSRPCSISTYSSNTSSLTDPYSMSFLTDNQTYYNQIIEDISVIDNVCDMFEEEHEFVLTDKQVLDSARHVVYKQQVITQIIQSETAFVNELDDFRDSYAHHIRTWLDTTEDREVETKVKATLHMQSIQRMFQSLNSLARLHARFLKHLLDRFDIWGPTQLVSDVFNNFHKELVQYQAFFDEHPRFMVALDTLYRLPGFTKLLETKIVDCKQRQTGLKIADLPYYLELPLNRITHYCKTIHQLKNYSDTASPDYTFLGQNLEKFKALHSDWSDRKRSCLAHLAVLEVTRTVQNCPISVTLNRRLIHQAELIKVDLDDLAGTSDVRTYFLFTDHLMFCSKKTNKKASLVYKGSLSLLGADVRHLPPALLTKMAHVKKSLFRIGKKSDDTAAGPAPAFGFEIITHDAQGDSVAPMGFSNGSLPSQSSAAPVRRRHILRTKTLEEQKLWSVSVKKVTLALQAKAPPVPPLPQ
ncbi:Dbl homology domain-containing protein [Sporodiniella umbellata]|nr:Dbl homology domain-containing protein [Sporodiniella umbellata]